MPTKVTATETATAPKAELDSVTVKTIDKLSTKLSTSAKGMKTAQDAAKKQTFKLFADFRKACRENFDVEKTGIHKKAARRLAVTVLATVYDVPIGSIRIDGTDPAVWVRGEKTVNSKGKEIADADAGEIISADEYEKLSDEAKKYIRHPKIDGASSLYQFASKLVNVAFPADDRATELVDEALEDDGTCTVTEDHLNKLANGTETEIVKKAGHGGKRDKVRWDKKKVIEEVTKIVKKGWNGEQIIPGYNGPLDLEDLSECLVGVISTFQAELDTAEKEVKKAAKGGKGDEE